MEKKHSRCSNIGKRFPLKQRACKRLWGVRGLVEMGSRVHLKQTINSGLILQTCSGLRAELCWDQFCSILRYSRCSLGWDLNSDLFQNTLLMVFAAAWTQAPENDRLRTVILAFFFFFFYRYHSSQCFVICASGMVLFSACDPRTELCNLVVVKMSPLPAVLAYNT